MRAAIAIDHRSKIPVHRQIYDVWRDGILRGRFAAHTRVPSSRDLAASLSVARSTVTQAYEQLIAEGYLATRRGSGTFVCGELPESLLHVRARGTRGDASLDAVRLSSYGERLQSDFPQVARESGVISFAHWTPDPSLFPLAIWRRLVMRHLRQASPEIFNYVADVQGYEPLRVEIARYLSRSRAVLCTPDQVMVVNGSQQALDLCARVLLNSGDSIAFEDPGYLGSRRIFAAHGAKLQPVRVDDEGLVVRELRSALAVYVTPSHQFPTGVALSLQRRLELIAWAKKNSSIIIEDDYDSEYRYSGAPLPALQGLAAGAPVVYCGSFSKVMFPGLRVGYLVAPKNLVALLRRAKWLSDRNTPMLEQLTLADFLREGHLERHVRRMRRLYASRRAALLDALQRTFGTRSRVLGDAAGMHALVRIDDPRLPERAARNRVQLKSASDYYVGRAPRNEYLFGFVGLGERAIREGIRRLSQ